MPKIRKPPPYFLKHLVDRFREGRISVDDFDALQDWLNSDPEVPPGKWYKRFPKFTLVGVKAQCPRHFSLRAWFPMERKFTDEKSSQTGSIAVDNCFRQDLGMMSSVWQPHPG
jgi:hypothetical protein